MCANTEKREAEEEESMMPVADSGPAVADNGPAVASRSTRNFERNTLKILFISLKSLLTRLKLPEPNISNAFVPTDLRNVPKPDRPQLNLYEPDESEDLGAVSRSIEARFQVDVLEKKITKEKEKEEKLKVEGKLPFLLSPPDLDSILGFWKNIAVSDPGKRAYFFGYWITFKFMLFFFLFIYSQIHEQDHRSFEKLQLSHISSQNPAISQKNSYKLEQAVIEIEFIKSISFSPESLIRLSAMYPRCIFHSVFFDEQNSKNKRLDQIAYNNTGCCVKNEIINGTYVACFQSHESECKATSFRFQKNHDSIGPVCGRDPNYCTSPPPDSFNKTDITEWKDCISYKADVKDAKHMNCNLLQSPCCLLTGECKLMGKTECGENGGTFHSDARFCSEVDCFYNLCGVQTIAFWRIIQSIFLVSGILQFVVEIIFFLFIVPTMEAKYGTLYTTFVFMSTAILDNILFIWWYPDLLTVSSTSGMTALFTFAIMEHAWYFIIGKFCQTDKDIDMSNVTWKLVLRTVIVGLVCIATILLTTSFVKLGQLLIGAVSGLIFSFILIVIPLLNKTPIQKSG
ncbi:unnamed protein product [Auanema sp. JU1783]|nr:unnamed protein product [Auanema sp. JU1783]